MSPRVGAALEQVRLAAREAADAGRLPDFLAALERVRAQVLLDAVASAVAEHQCGQAPDEQDVLTLQDAADFMGEPASTFRRRLEYRRALVSKATERRLRYSREALDQIRQERLEGSATARL